MDNHTPGPWKATRNEDVWLITAGKETHLGLFDGGYPYDREANARLAASAPELLEALQDMLKMLPGDFGPFVIKARAVLARAKGDA